MWPPSSFVRVVVHTVHYRPKASFRRRSTCTRTVRGGHVRIRNKKKSRTLHSIRRRWNTSNVTPGRSSIEEQQHQRRCGYTVLSPVSSRQKKRASCCAPESLFRCCCCCCCCCCCYTMFEFVPRARFFCRRFLVASTGWVFGRRSSSRKSVVLGFFVVAVVHGINTRYILEKAVPSPHENCARGFDPL